MVQLRAAEHRYLAAVTQQEAEVIRQVPGCRWVPAASAFQLPRQPGTVRALDRLFGESAWEHGPDLAREVLEARDIEPAPAAHEATVELSGSELAVLCAFADKELVKLVPGYRWSAAQRLWYVPAWPMSLALLEDYFGGLLRLPARLREDLEELHAGQSLPIGPHGSRGPGAPPGPPAIPPAEASEPAGDPLLARLDRLAGAVEELVALLRGGHGALQVPPAPMLETTPSAALDEPGLAASEDWRELLRFAAAEPEEARRRVAALLQTAGEDEVRPYLALAGIVSEMLGEHAEALRSLRRSLDGPPLEPGLDGHARETYARAALNVLTAALAPTAPIDSPAALSSLLLREVHTLGAGFDPARLDGKDAMDTLQYLVTDPVLRVVDPALSDACRVAHLLAVSRGNTFMAAERVADLLRDRDLGADGFALAAGVMANALFEADALDGWRYRWPSGQPAAMLKDLRWLVEGALTRLPDAGPEPAAMAALACLACVVGGPPEWASAQERKLLLSFIRQSAPERDYAEFLAAFALAAAGRPGVAKQFPGYIPFLARTPLEVSAGHLVDVFMMQGRGPASPSDAIAATVIPAALGRGLPDPAVLLDLLDVVAVAPRGDQLLNRLGSMVEDGEFVGADRFSHQQRLALFRRALEEARNRGHDHDGVEAFNRVSRELLAHGEVEALRTLCHDLETNFNAIRHATLEVALELALEAGEPFEPLAETLLKLANRANLDALRHELAGLSLLYPEMSRFLEERGFIDEDLGPADGELTGQRLVVIGGHQWQKKHALPVLEGSWGMKVTWLDPAGAKNGAQALDLVRGAADLVIINVACISHAASGRVIKEAEASGLRVIQQDSRGVGAVLACVRAGIAEAPAEAASSEAAHRRAERRRRIR